MSFTLYIVFVLGVALFNGAQGKMCNTTDVKCLTNGAKNLYRSLIPGIDPLHLDKIEGKIENLKYQLTNVNLAGMGKCEVIHLSGNTEELSYYELLSCPELILNFNDEAGLGKITATEYIIIINGKYGSLVSEKDHKPHFFLGDYIVETNPKGKLIFDVKERIFKDNERFLEDIIKKFMVVIMAKYNAAVRERTTEEMFPDIK